MRERDRGMKINGKDLDASFVKKDAVNGESGKKRETQNAKEFAHNLTSNRGELDHARRQVEILIKQNVRLQNELAESVKKETQARYLAHHDGLTQLPNRALLQDRFRQAVLFAKRYHKSLALLMLDLDGFKLVNDELGHDVGDELLLMVARRLTRSIRGADTVCRYGGDEFVIMLSEIEGSKAAADFIVKIRALIGQSYVIDGYEIQITSSVGVAIYPEDGRTFEDLIKRADLAMYCVKSTACPVSITAVPGNVSLVTEIRKYSPANHHGARRRLSQDGNS